MFVFIPWQEGTTDGEASLCGGNIDGFSAALHYISSSPAEEKNEEDEKNEKDKDRLVLQGLTWVRQVEGGSTCLKCT